MTHEEIMRMMSQQMGGGSGGQQIQVSKEEVDKRVNIFIERCLKEKDYTLQSLGQDVYYCLSPPQGHAVMLQIGMEQVLPLILNRIQELIGGER